MQIFNSIDYKDITPLIFNALYNLLHKKLEMQITHWSHFADKEQIL